MTRTPALEAQLGEVRVQLAVRRGFLYLLMALMWELLLLGAWMLSSRLWPQALPSPLDATGMRWFLLPPLAALIWGLTQRPPLRDTAIYCDRRLGSHDSISTSLELGRETTFSSLSLPWPVPSHRDLAAGALGLLIGFTGLALGEDMSASVSKIPEPKVRELRNQADKIQKASLMVKEGQKLRQAADEMRKLAKEIAEGKTSKEDLMASAAAARETLEKARADVTRPETLLQSLKDKGPTPLSEALSGPDEKLSRLARDLEEGRLGDKDKADMAQRLKEAAAQAAASGNPAERAMAEKLGEAAKALEEGKGSELASALKALKEAAQSDCQGLTPEEVEALQNLAEAMDQLGALPLELSGELDPELLKELAKNGLNPEALKALKLCRACPSNGEP